MPTPLPLPEFVAVLCQGQRLIGMDLGTRTIGLALSDVGRRIASPLDTVRREKLARDMEKILGHVARHDVGGFVLGLPINMDGSHGPRVQSTQAFVRNLRQFTALPVLLWDERLSTVAAERAMLEADLSRAKRAEKIDQQAATFILQGALDAINFRSHAD